VRVETGTCLTELHTGTLTGLALESLLYCSSYLDVDLRVSDVTLLFTSGVWSSFKWSRSRHIEVLHLQIEMHIEVLHLQIEMHIEVLHLQI
jgi:hypothetical protein